MIDLKNTPVSGHSSRSRDDSSLIRKADNFSEILQKEKQNHFRDNNSSYSAKFSDRPRIQFALNSDGQGDLSRSFIMENSSQKIVDSERCGNISPNALAEKIEKASSIDIFSLKQRSECMPSHVPQ